MIGGFAIEETCCLINQLEFDNWNAQERSEPYTHFTLTPVQNYTLVVDTNPNFFKPEI